MPYPFLVGCVVSFLEISPVLVIKRLTECRQVIGLPVFTSGGLKIGRVYFVAHIK